MKRDENETLCWIMIWGWMTWKQSLAFNNDDGKNCTKKKINKSIYKKLYNLFTKKNKKIKTSLPPSLSPFVSLYPCTLPWNRNQKTIKGKFSTDQDRILTFPTADNNLHWPLSIHPHQLPRLPFSLPPGPPFLFLLLSLILHLFLHFLLLWTSKNLRYFIK